MTADDQVRYGALAGAVSLREDIVARAIRAYSAAQRMRLIILIAAALISGLQIACYAEWLPSSTWVNEHAYGISFGALAASLFASGNTWSCRLRRKESQSRLEDFLAHLPSH